MSRKFHEKVESLNPAFRWRDVPRAISYFLEEDKAKFVTAFFGLFIILFYDLVPPYIAGKIVDFFSLYRPGDSLKHFYSLTFFLGGSFIVASMIRNESKKAISLSGHRARSRARIRGFDRLAEFSLQWHAKENTGSKVQRIFTGSQALKEWANIINRDLLRFCVVLIGVFLAFFYSNPMLAIFMILFIGCFVLIQVIFNKKLVNLTDEFN